MRTQPIQIFLILTMGGLPAYSGYCSTEDIMHEYKNNNEYITDPRSPLWGKGIRNPEYKPKLTEWTTQTITYRIVVDGKTELRCKYGERTNSFIDTLYTESYICGSVKILHTLTKRKLQTYSYALIDKNNQEFSMKQEYDIRNDQCRCVYGPSNLTRSTICTQKLYNEYVNIDFIQETSETETTKPRPQL